MEGTVKWYNRKKGFGFIQGEDGADYFVHFSALQQGTFIRDDDKVSFDAVDTEKGKQAQNVALVQKASDRTDLPAKEEGEEQPQEEQQEFTQEIPSEEPAEEPAEEPEEKPEEPAEEPEEKPEEPAEEEKQE